jgi:hypothetical protein
LLNHKLNAELREQNGNRGPNETDQVIGEEKNASD